MSIQGAFLSQGLQQEQKNRKYDQIGEDCADHREADEHTKVLCRLEI